MDAINNFINNLQLDVPLLLWYVVLALVVLVIAQLLYLIILSSLPMARRSRRGRDLPVRAEAYPGGYPAGVVQAAPPAAPMSAAPQGYVPQAYNVPPTGFSTSPAVQIAPPANIPAAVRAERGSSANINNTPVVAPTAAPPPIAPVTVPQSSPGADSGTPRLIVLEGLSEQLEMNLPGTDFAVGRFYNQERRILVFLDEKSISREHAHINYNAALAQYFLTDKSSSYGTYLYLNDRFEPLTPDRPERLFNGDVVQFGNVVKVRFILPGETRASITQL